MKRQALTHLTITSLIVLFTNTQPIQASTNSPEANQSPVESVQQLVQDGQDLFSSLQQGISSFISDLQLPDFEGILNDIFTVDDPIVLSTSSQVENKPGGSYGIQDDLTDQALINSAEQVAQDTTLSQSAQSVLENIAIATAGNITTTQQLGQDAQNLGQASQQLDVSQHILQNLSAQSALTAQQSALAATRQGVIIQQNQQAQIDRAVGNVLAAQQAKTLAEAATTKRREDAAAGVYSTAALGLIRMPGVTANDSVSANSQALDPDTLLGN
jgi:hypothetical protein